MEGFLSNPDLIEGINTAFLGVALTLIAAIGWGLRTAIQMGVDWLKVKLGSERYDLITKQAYTMVRYLEQSPIFEKFDGAQKKELLMVDLAKFAESHKIPIGRETLDKIAEAAVRVVKKEIGVVDFGEVDGDIDDWLEQ